MKTRLLFILITLSLMLFGCSKSEDLPEVVTYTVTTNVSKLNGGDGEVKVKGVSVPSSGILVTNVSSGGSVTIVTTEELGTDAKLTVNGVTKNAASHTITNIRSNYVANVVLEKESFDIVVSASDGGSVVFSKNDPYFYGDNVSCVITASPDSVIHSVKIDGVFQSGVAGTTSFTKNLSITDEVSIEVVFLMTRIEWIINGYYLITKREDRLVSGSDQEWHNNPISSCHADDKFYFLSSGRFENYQGPNKCFPDFPDLFSNGDWSVNSDVSILNWGGTDYIINNLTAREMVVTFTIYGSVTLESKETYSKP